jgi:hypothetical protein
LHDVVALAAIGSAVDATDAFATGSVAVATGSVAFAAVCVVLLTKFGSVLIVFVGESFLFERER